MLTVNKLLPQGQGLAAVLLKRAATVELDWDLRQKSRFEATDSAGRRLGVFLARGTVVRGGDVLVAQDGSLIRVSAAPQAVLVVRACAQHGSPFDLLRAAYHLGNRHVQLELQPDHLKLEPDHVLADMLRQMHLIVSDEQSGFEPEAGAYASAGHSHAGHGAHADHGHGHDHDHSGHEHGHAHGQTHGHTQVQGHAPVASPARTVASNTPRSIAIPVLAAQPHVHGPGCSHHGHDHDHAPHDRPAAAAPTHVHGPDCGHEPGHATDHAPDTTRGAAPDGHRH